jgi:SNF2 family DNA or RNA helicase
MLADQIFKTTPYKHQLEALEQSRDKRVYALLMEMGTGKTKVVIDTVSYLFGLGKVNAMLVVAPKSICTNWAKKEIGAHLPDHVERRVVLWQQSTDKFEKELAQLTKVEPMKLHVLVINVEALATDRGYKAAERFLRGHDALFVIDESTIIKNPTATRTKRAIKLGNLAAYRRIMTGTPVTQSPLDIYAQFGFLDTDILRSSSYYGFRNQYAVLRKRYVNGRSFDEVVGFQRLNELKELLRPHSYRALKRECLDLPAKIYETRTVELTDAQRRYYNQIKDDALAILNDGSVVAAPLVITQLLRLRQALCNIAPTVEGGPTVTIDDRNPRLDAVLELLEEAGDQKVIIWANFVPSVKLLNEGIGKEFGREKVAYISGEVPALRRQEIVEQFQDPEHPLKYLVMQTRTGGYGLTLTAATLVIYHDNDWSLEVRLQSEDRAHRIGQKNSVTYIDLVAPDTVEEKILASLMSKQELADRVTGDKLRQLLA